MARSKSKDLRDPANAIRIGAEINPLADLYFAMLEASWARLIGVLVLLYIAANLIFALAYASCGDCVAAVRPGSFSDAFFFSVQTISTIGYGHLYPKTNFAEAIVTIESLCGLLGFALVTGVFPGEVQVLAQREGVGRFRAAGPVLVETARRSQVRVDTTVVAGRLRLVDAGGEPHRNKRVLLAGGGLSHSAETSADGRLDVLLRPGVVTVSLRHHDRTSGKLQRDRAELAWPPPNGEVELKLLPE
mgnify:CR=1 FL=1